MTTRTRSKAVAKPRRAKSNSKVASLERKVAELEAKLYAPGPGWTRIFETYPGQWQQDVSVELNSVLTFGAVFACIRLIATDIGKLRVKLMERVGGVWQETESPSFSPVLRKPNSKQTRIKFYEQRVQSKLIHGNTYVLKVRDNRGVVAGMYVLDPTKVQALLSDSGDVFYRLNIDHYAGIDQAEIVVPAREIIHDVHMTPEHPLIGVSPIGACGLAATQGLKIQNNSAKHFANMSRPAGILTAPGAISDATAARLKASWETNYGGENFGKTAVLGDGLKYDPVATTAVDAQLIEQLGWTAEDVCRAFGVPAYKVGVGQMPAYNNINALDQAYYSQTLQEFIECIELLLDEGLALPTQYRCEFDLEQLIRMDALTQTQVLGERIKNALISPNEGRAKIGYSPTEGGDSPMMQQQNFSLAALARRDSKDDPFSTAQPKPEPPQESDEDVEAEARMFKAMAYEVATCSAPVS